MVTVRLTGEECQILICLAKEGIEGREEMRLPRNKTEHGIVVKLEKAWAISKGIPYEEDRAWNKNLTEL